MPEIAGDAASYFNPESPEDMAEQIIRVLKDEGLRHNLIQKGWTRALRFRWEKTAAETLEFYRSVSGRE
jgi:glycosyltransferase involved in cell wall biosynthesis